MKKTLYRVGIDFQQFDKDLNNAGVSDLTWSNVVETFVEYQESVTEILQLLSVSPMDEHVPHDMRQQEYLKAVFEVYGENQLRQITPRVHIDQQEYYDKKLLSFQGEDQSQSFIETKMRLKCSLADDLILSVERQLETGFTILQFEHKKERSPLEFFELLPSVQWRIQEDATLEEIFWEYSKKMSWKRHSDIEKPVILS